MYLPLGALAPVESRSLDSRRAGLHQHRAGSDRAPGRAHCRCGARSPIRGRSTLEAAPCPTPPRWLLPTNRAPRHIYQPCIRNFGMSIRPTTLRGMRWPCEPPAEVRRSGGRPHRTSQCHAFASLFAQSTWPRSAQGRLLVKSKLIVPSIPRARTCFLPAGGRVLIGPHRRGCSGSSNRSLP